MSDTRMMDACLGQGPGASEEVEEGAEVSIDEPPPEHEDLLRLGEEGWRTRYYEQKFGQPIANTAFVKELALVG